MSKEKNEHAALLGSIGGKKTVETLGKEHMREVGRKGGIKSGETRRRKAEEAARRREEDR